jgi:orotate phosphoribosyltransferase
MKNDNVSTLLDLIRTTCYEYRDSPFKLSSGHYSNHYFDCRNLLSSPEGFYLVGEVLSEVLIKQILNNKTYPTDMDNYIPKCRMTPYETCYKSLDIQAVGGMSTGAIPVANSIMATLLYKHNIDINTFYVRKIDKPHGKVGKVVGIVNKTDNVIIIDDVLTTGNSIMSAIETVQEERSAEVVAILTLIDREEGGKDDIISKFNIPVFSVFTMTDILNVKDRN